MIKIKYNDIEGILNINTGEVMFYQFKYSGIIEAIRRLDHDIKSNKQEIEIFNSIFGNVDVELTSN